MFGRALRTARRAVKAGDAQAIVQLLADPDPKVRADTANQCMNLASDSLDPSVVAALLRAAGDPNAKVRGQAILALGTVRVSEARDLFLRALSDEDWLVRMFAATAIGWMPDPRAIEPVIKLLDEDEPLVRQAAAFTLGAIGQPGAVPPLRALLETEHDRDVRSALDDALAKLGTS